MRNYFALFIFHCCLLISCTSTPDTNDIPIQTDKNKTTATKATVLLIFKTENNIEIWQQGEKIHSQNNVHSQGLPIGIFNIDQAKSKGNQLSIVFPNEYYQQKKWQTLDLNHSFKLSTDIPLAIQELEQVLIFPNDIRQQSNFIPCFACPHWMAELYSSMKIHAMKYVSE